MGVRGGMSAVAVLAASLAWSGAAAQEAVYEAEDSAGV